MLQFFSFSVYLYTVTENVFCLVRVISLKRKGGFVTSISATWHIGVAPGDCCMTAETWHCSIVWMWQKLMLTVSTKQSIWRSLELVLAPHKLQNQAWGVSLGAPENGESDISLPQPLVTPLSTHTRGCCDTGLAPLCHIPYKSFLSLSCF